MFHWLCHCLWSGGRDIIASSVRVSGPFLIPSTNLYIYIYYCAYSTEIMMITVYLWDIFNKCIPVHNERRFDKCQCKCSSSVSQVGQCVCRRWPADPLCPAVLGPWWDIYMMLLCSQICWWLCSNMMLVLWRLKRGSRVWRPMGAPYRRTNRYHNALGMTLPLYL